MQVFSRRDQLGIALYATCFCVLLWSWPVVPSQDYPAWVAEAVLLREHWRGALPASCHFVGTLPPNALAQGVIAALSFALPVDAAGRVYLCLCVLLLAAAFAYLLRVRDRDGESLVGWVCLPLLVGYPIYHGFLNYLAALPLLCFALGYLLRNPEAEGWRGGVLLWLIPLLAYTCHGTALGIWIVLVAVQFWVRRSSRFACKACLGLVPVLLLGLAYTHERIGEGAGVVWSAGDVASTLSYRARSLFRFFSLFHGFVPNFGDPLLRVLAPLLVVLNVSFTAAVSCAGIVWAWRRRNSRDPGERLIAYSVLVLTALFCVLPHNVAKMLNPAERLLLPAAFFAAAGIAGRAHTRTASRHRARLRIGVGVLAIAQLAYVILFGSRAAAAAADFVSAVLSYRKVGEVQVLPDDQLTSDFVQPKSALNLLTRHQVLANQATLLDAQQGHVHSAFETGLFRCTQPTAAVPSLQAAQSGEQLGPILILIGERERSVYLAHALAPVFRSVRAGAGFWVLSRQP
jgi:hypothetical protein